MTLMIISQKTLEHHLRKFLKACQKAKNWNIPNHLKLWKSRKVVKKPQIVHQTLYRIDGISQELTWYQALPHRRVLTESKFSISPPRSTQYRKERVQSQRVNLICSLVLVSRSIVLGQKLNWTRTNWTFTAQKSAYSSLVAITQPSRVSYLHMKGDIRDRINWGTQSPIKRRITVGSWHKAGVRWSRIKGRSMGKKNIIQPPLRPFRYSRRSSKIIAGLILSLDVHLIHKNKWAKKTYRQINFLSSRSRLQEFNLLECT